MTFSIHSRKLDETFDFTTQGGYIFLERDGKRRQICYGGRFLGNALKAGDRAYVERVCRSWYRSYMRQLGA